MALCGPPGFIMSKMWTIKKDVLEKDLSYQLVGLLFKIHKKLGRFARERQYCDAIEISLCDQKINFLREYPLWVAGRPSNRVDFLVEKRIILEIKAKPYIAPEDFYQTRRYLDTSNIKLGMIVNFREKYLHPRRVLNPNLPRHS